jgi:hypothetical protein
MACHGGSKDQDENINSVYNEGHWDTVMGKMPKKKAPPQFHDRKEVTSLLKYGA